MTNLNKKSLHGWKGSILFLIFKSRELFVETLFPYLATGLLNLKAQESRFSSMTGFNWENGYNQKERAE